MKSAPLASPNPNVGAEPILELPETDELPFADANVRVEYLLAGSRDRALAGFPNRYELVVGSAGLVMGSLQHLKAQRPLAVRDVDAPALDLPGERRALEPDGAREGCVREGALVKAALGHPGVHVDIGGSYSGCLGECRHRKRGDDGSKTQPTDVPGHQEKKDSRVRTRLSCLHLFPLTFGWRVADVARIQFPHSEDTASAARGSRSSEPSL